MSIASEIARITAARNKTRAQAVALGLKTWAIQARKVFTSGMTCDFTTPFILDASKTYKVRVSVTEDYLQFCEYDNLYDATEDGLRLNAMDENDIGWSNWLYASDLVNHTTWEHIISGVGRNTLNICCYLYNDCTDEYPLTMEVFTLETITETDNLDAVADAFDAMPVYSDKQVSGGTMGGTPMNVGYYKGCSAFADVARELALLNTAFNGKTIFLKVGSLVEDVNENNYYTDVSSPDRIIFYATGKGSCLIPLPVEHHALKVWLVNYDNDAQDEVEQYKNNITVSCESECIGYLTGDELLTGAEIGELAGCAVKVDFNFTDSDEHCFALKFSVTLDGNNVSGDPMEFCELADLIGMLDIENGVIGVGGTAALENRVSELETELTNIEAELKEL